ncbi:MAG: hypothetical protein N2508_00280 [Anaerolineae bacterium]|nr:hypothetical protein [Anaerolineae bacterium]
MATESWLPALLGYLLPVGFFLLAWGGMEAERAQRATTVAALAMALATLGYFVAGFAFHLGGAWLVVSRPGLEGLKRIFAGEGGLSWGLIGLAGFFLSGEAATPEVLSLFVIYLPMVMMAVLLPVLSLYGRARGWQVVVVGLAVATLFFPLVACWVWGGGWLANLGQEDVLGRGHGFVDHAGGGVVYLLGGLVALGGLLGLRKGMPDAMPPQEPGKPAEMPPAHFPLLANLGALLFGLGWIGWALSEPFHVAGAELNLPRIAVNGLLAGIGGTLTSQLYCWAALGRVEALMSARGAVAGWIAAAAGAPFLSPGAALFTGALAGLLLPVAVYLVDHLLRLPDGTAAIPLGLVGGGWGVLATALFADGRWGQGWNRIGWEDYLGIAGQGVSGLFPAGGFRSDPGQLVAQLAGIGTIGLLAFLGGWLLLLLLNLPYRLRQTGEVKAVSEERAGRAALLRRVGQAWKTLFALRQREVTGTDESDT